MTTVRNAILTALIFCCVLAPLTSATAQRYNNFYFQQQQQRQLQAQQQRMIQQQRQQEMLRQRQREAQRQQEIRRQQQLLQQQQMERMAAQRQLVAQRQQQLLEQRQQQFVQQQRAQGQRFQQEKQERQQQELRQQRLVQEREVRLTQLKQVLRTSISPQALSVQPPRQSEKNLTTGPTAQKTASQLVLPGSKDWPQTKPQGSLRPPQNAVAPTTSQKTPRANEQYVLAGFKQGPLNNLQGNSFERRALQALGATKNTSGVTAINSRTTTVPDLPIGKKYGVTDIKNVRKLSFDRQLRAQAEIAKTNNLPFNLIISKRTKIISKQLLAAIKESNNENGGKIEVFDPETGQFKEAKIVGNRVIHD